ncbi:HTH-type transcriptional regulator NorG [Microbacterium oxydans]|uniref:HTH-type transcriptional regulator NorG n=1 Tax=Microbacterium oxydans TaxID=82380 RepID=A0A0F0KJU6_9MICO|nr:PLP-dependent aminotransferase family protein [Microbacterium oxydans]KJL20420.1 HTH-type transcriptional regulator NorG [Microbacterium oxydans]
MGDSSADLIVTELRAWIDTVGAGARLPSSRELARRHGASPVTVQKAMRTLVGLGLIESRSGVGSFVRGARPPKPLDFRWQTSALRSAAERVPELSTPLRDIAVDVIGLQSGYPARELLPERAVRAALSRAGRSEHAVNRPPAAGLPALQAWFATELAEVTPAGVASVSPRDVCIVPGTQSALGSAFRGLAGHGQPVLMESPTYWGAILAAAQAGLRVVPVVSDAEGPDPDDLRSAFRESGAKVFYAQPNFANPTGAQWTPERKNEILSVVRDVGAFLIEDDWARDFGIDADSVPLAGFDDAGHVVYIRSLTKSVSPAIRVGAVIARGPARERLLADRSAESMYVSGLLQAAALDVVLQPAWRSHLRTLRGTLRDRRDLLVASVQDMLPEAVVTHVPAGGLNLWLQLPDRVDLERLVRDCDAAGVLIASGTEWFPSEPSGKFIRLNYAGPDASRFPEGVGVVRAALVGQRI